MARKTNIKIPCEVAKGSSGFPVIVLMAELAGKPGTCKSPAALCRSDGDTPHSRRFRSVNPAKYRSFTSSAFSGCLEANSVRASSTANTPMFGPYTVSSVAWKSSRRRSPPRFRRPLRRARSTRMRRMDSGGGGNYVGGTATSIRPDIPVIDSSAVLMETPY